MIHLLLAVIYVSFISLGLPDSLLGAAWPSIYQGFGVPVSYSGVIFCIISVGTVLSSLQSFSLTVHNNKILTTSNTGKMMRQHNGYQITDPVNESCR